MSWGPFSVKRANSTIFVTAARMRFWSSVLIFVLLFCFPSSFLPLAHAEEKYYTITFSTETFANPYTVYLDFRIRVSADLPSKINSGELGSLKVDVWKDWTSATLKYEPFLPQESQFLTPLGDSDRIYLGTFLGELIYYVQLTNASVRMETNIEGNGTVTPRSVLWVSPFEEKTLIVSHSGLESSKERLTIEMSFAYSGLLTMLSVTPVGIIVEKETSTLGLNGVTVSENIDVTPKPTVSPLIVEITLLVLLGIMLFGGFAYWLHTRRLNQPEKLNVKPKVASAKMLREVGIFRLLVLFGRCLWRPV